MIFVTTFKEREYPEKTPLYPINKNKIVQCDKCEKSFTRGSHSSRHMIIHDNVKSKPDSAIDFHEKSALNHTRTKTSLIKNIPRLMDLNLNLKLI